MTNPFDSCRNIFSDDGKFTAKDLEDAREVAIRAGFILAKRAAASLARQEGFVDLAAKIDALQLLKKRESNNG